MEPKIIPNADPTPYRSKTKKSDVFTTCSDDVELTEVHVVEIAGGMAAIHNMPCAVCWTKYAVIDMDSGIFEPCWDCQKKGYRVSVKRRWPWQKRDSVVY